MTPSARTKPLLRGVSHEVMFFVSLLAGAILVAVAPSERAAVTGGIYAASLATMFGVSALYHRPTWAPVARRRMRRLDHATIFLFIAGTYTPLAWLALAGHGGRMLLVAIWIAAALGVVVAIFWTAAPRWVTVSLYIAVGWMALVALPAIFTTLGGVALALIVAGGLLYTVGAVIYAAKRPDPLPRTFGYHEIFHALVIAASVCHFLVVGRVVLGG